MKSAGYRANLKGKKGINCWYAIYIVAIIIGFILDFTIKHNIITPFIVVLDDYIGIVFGGLCTVAALGNAIQSIIISAHSNKIFGFTVKDLLNFDASNYKFRSITLLSLGPVIFAIIMLALKACNTITAVAIVVLLFMISSSQQIWSLVSNEKDERELIEKEIELKLKGDSNPDFFLNIWFPELQNAVERNDANLQDTYIGLIRRTVAKCSESNKDISVLLGTYLSNIFSVAVKHLGFVVAYRKILCLDAQRVEIGADLDSIIHEYINQIQFCPESNLYTYKIANTIEDILDELEVDEFTKRRYIFGFYRAVVANSIISDKTRYDLINSIAQKLCNLRDRKGGDLRMSIILIIARESILQNENEKERNQICSILLDNLYRYNRYSRERCYCATITQLFRALYFYSHYETETLDNTYREKLATIYHYHNSGKNKQKITLGGLVRERSDDVVKWLADSATIYYKQERIFDYFPADFVFKRSIWEQKNLIQFAFLVYAVYGYGFLLFPSTEIVGNESIDVKQRKYICTVVTGMFENEMVLNEEFKRELCEMQKFLGTNQVLPKVMLQRNFQYFNEQLKKFIRDETVSIQLEDSNDIKKLTERLQAKLKDINSFEFNERLSLDKGQRFDMRPYLREIRQEDVEVAAQMQFDHIMHILNLIVREILPEKPVQYDLVGVKDLLGILSCESYRFTNYEYPKDYGIGSETRKTDEFKELEELFSKMTVDNTRTIQSSVILKTDKIDFNVSIIDYHLDTPTELQCEDYLESFKIAEGKYRLENAIYDFVEAITYIKTHYRAESSSICIATNLTEDSGFRIVYQPRNK